jgi:hypothetical protein
MSQVFENSPHPSTLAPPASPDEEPDSAGPGKGPLARYPPHVAPTDSLPSSSADLTMPLHLKVSLVLENSGSVARDHLASVFRFLL